MTTLSTSLTELTDLVPETLVIDLFEQGLETIKEIEDLASLAEIVRNHSANIQVSNSFMDDLSTDEFVAVAGSCCIFDPGPDPLPDPDPQPTEDETSEA